MAALPVRGDDVRPVQVRIREREPGTFLVEWEVPRVLPARAAPTPALPGSCRPQGEPTIRVEAAAWLGRQVYRCPDGLSGLRIGVDFPFGNPSLSTVLRVEVLSGERYATVLSPAQESWGVPAADSPDAILRSARNAVLAGVLHVLRSGVDLVFLLAIVALGSVRLVGAFGGGQVAGVLLGVLGVRMAPVAGELALVVAVLILAREAVRSPGGRSSTEGVAIAAGVCHGLGWMAASTGGAAVGLLGVLGMDVTLLALGAGLGWIAGRSQGIRRGVAYAAGIGGVALGLGLWTAGTPVEATARNPGAVPIPEPGSEGSGGRASQRISPRSPDAALQSFVSIEAFEVRNEVLVRLRDVIGEVGRVRDTVAVEAQPDLVRRVADIVSERVETRVDGVSRAATVDRAVFVTVDPQGVLPRPAPVPEPLDGAFVGVTLAVITPTTARSVDVAWSGFDLVPTLPVTLTDPEASRATELTAADPSVRWENHLEEDPVPTVSAVPVEPTRIPVPLLSLAILVAGLALALPAARKRRPRWTLAVARTALAVALLVGPLADVAVASPFGAAPSPGQAKRILAGILPNVYRALEFREESAAYDRLAVSIDGPALTDIYLEHRRALEMEDRGGARARVEAVEVLAAPRVTPAVDGGFGAEASWTVSGTVTHFGHRHFRQNRYDARVVIVPVGEAWKIRSIEVLDERRVR